MLPNGSPLTVNILTRALRMSSMAALGVDMGVTLHSLRKAASQACHKLGLHLDKIKQAGTWKSKAVSTYLDNSNVRDAPIAISTLLG